MILLFLLCCHRCHQRITNFAFQTEIELLSQFCGVQGDSCCLKDISYTSGCEYLVCHSAYLLVSLCAKKITLKRFDESLPNLVADF